MNGLSHHAYRKPDWWAGLQASLLTGLFAAGLDTMFSALVHGVWGFELAFVALGSFCLSTLFLLMLAPLWMVERLGPVARILDSLGTRSHAIGLLVVSLSVAAVLHGINATLYLRLYLAVHFACTLATLAIAWVATYTFSVHARRRSGGAPGLGRFAAVVWPLALVFWVLSARDSEAARVAALEHSVILGHELIALDHLGIRPRSVFADLEDGDDDHGLGEKRVDVQVGSAPLDHLLLITVDAMRADAMPDPSGRSHAGLIEIAKLARESTWFTSAYSPSCSTVFAMSSVLRSRYPSEIAFQNVSVVAGPKLVERSADALLQNPLSHKQVTPVPLRDAHPTLAGSLTRAGYETATVISYIFYLREAGVTRDFVRVEDARVRSAHLDGMGMVDVPLVDEGLRWIDGRQSDRPFFLWLHFMEPHAPYAPWDEDGSASDAERYRSELRHVDAQLGKLIEGLRARALWDKTVLVLHADHGEEFGDHGGRFHGTTLYEEVVRVPWLIRLPERRRRAAPRRIDDPVSLLDLYPTVIDLLGVPEPAPLRGRSLLPALEGRETTVLQRPIVAQCPRFGRDKHAVRQGSYKALFDRALGTVELYHLAKDPLERENLADQEPARVDALAGIALTAMGEAGRAGE